MKIDFKFSKEFDRFMGSLEGSPHYKELADLDGIGKQMDMVGFSKDFFGKPPSVADVSVDSNANVDDKSVIAYEVEVGKPSLRLNAYYLLHKYGSKLFGTAVAEEMVRMQFQKDVYINDFHKFGTQPYCFNFSTLDVVFNGLPFVDKILSEPPKHLTSFIGQVVQFVTYASNSVAGAVGLADFFICCSYYVEDGMTEREIKQQLQQFIYSVNQPFRGGHQSAFTNVSLFDKYFLEKMCNEYTFPDGTRPDIAKVQYVQDLFMELMNDTLSRTQCTFPVTTACFSVDNSRDVRDDEFLAKIVEQNKKYGWINIFAGKTSTLSSCCRLRSEAEHEYFNSFGAGGTKIGSMSVVTVNLPRLAYRNKIDILPIWDDEVKERQERTDWFIKQLQNTVRFVGYINQVKRHIVEERVANGYLPLYTLGFMDTKKQYNTCGLNGINEAVEILGYDILTPEGQAVVDRLLDTVNEVNAELEKEFSCPFNCEQTPSENSAIKLAQADKIMGYNTEYELYSNQFIPLTVNADLFDRVKLQGRFDSKMTGGAILHVNVGEEVTDNSKMERFLRGSIKQGVIYQAINYVLNVCEEHHVTVGTGDICTICGKPIQNKLSRVVGFLTSVKNWAKVRREHDFPNRQWY